MFWSRKLLGDYSLVREITPLSKVIEGRANFTLEEKNSFIYCEEGEYFISGIQYLFSQKQFWIFRKNSLEIYTKEGSLLYSMPLDKVITGKHLCSQDQYHFNLTFYKNSIIMNYLVLGPNKNYKIRSQLEKLQF